jgi:hypothetical protein
VSTFLRRFIAEARRQTNVNTESPEIHRIRMTAASLSIVIGLLGAGLLVTGNFSPVEFPAFLGYALGGAFGIGAHAARDTRLSRLMGWAALVSTSIGLIWFAVVKAFL